MERNLRVLVVDDEPDILETLEFSLSRRGFEVATAVDGLEGLEKAKRMPPDFMILDVMLPGKSGFDILRELRDIPETTDLPVLILTAKGQGRDREMAERFGVTRFMTKPFANSEVLETVNAMQADAVGDA